MVLFYGHRHKLSLNSIKRVRDVEIVGHIRYEELHFTDVYQI